MLHRTVCLWVFLLENILIRPLWPADLLLDREETNYQYLLSLKKILKEANVMSVCWNISSGIRGVPLQPSCKQDHLCQGRPARWHHQLSEAQGPQRPAQRLVTQTQLSHVSGQQDHASHCQGGDDPQPAVKREHIVHYFMFWFIFVCLFFFSFSENAFEYTVYWRTVNAALFPCHIIGEESCSTRTAPQLCSFFYCPVKHWQ